MRATVRFAGMAAALVCCVPFPLLAQTSPEIDLFLRHGPGKLDVTLEWTGGLPSFEIYGSGDVKAVCDANASLGVSGERIWLDFAPPGTVFYRVHSAAAAEPPETCNGADDDCDGIADDDAGGCSAALCETCVGGACRSRCGPCEDCVGGTCQTRCGACQGCLNGACAPCNAAPCQTCVNGVCASTCDEAQCLVCGPGGTCVSACATCETCVAGICMDACDHDQCLACQSGTCRPFCDPVCQTCTPQGCRDDCGPCQRCAGGACRSLCDPNACEECVDGMCRFRCAAGETCVGGVCGGTGASAGPAAPVTERR
jgi:hypothetical protein